jgi:hypothetical protein
MKKAAVDVLTDGRHDGDNYWTLSPDPNHRVVT